MWWSPWLLSTLSRQLSAHGGRFVGVRISSSWRCIAVSPTCSSSTFSVNRLLFLYHVLHQRRRLSGGARGLCNACSLTVKSVCLWAGQQREFFDTGRRTTGLEATLSFHLLTSTSVLLPTQLPTQRWVMSYRKAVAARGFLPPGAKVRGAAPLQPATPILSALNKLKNKHKLALTHCNANAEIPNFRPHMPPCRPSPAFPAATAAVFWPRDEKRCAMYTTLKAEERSRAVQ